MHTNSNKKFAEILKNLIENSIKNVNIHKQFVSAMYMYLFISTYTSIYSKNWAVNLVNCMQIVWYSCFTKQQQEI
jgi:hypothetical protein